MEAGDIVVVREGGLTILVLVVPSSGEGIGMTFRRDVVIVSVHGTGDSEPDKDSPKWWEENSKFASAVISRLSDRGICARFMPVQWGGANSHTERLEGTKIFADQIHTHCKNSDVHVVAHSHGGNVVLDAFSQLNGIEDNIKSVLLVGTPHLRRVSSPMEWVFLLVACIAFGSLTLLSFNANLYFSQCAEGSPTGLFDWLRAQTTSVCSRTEQPWGPFSWLLSWKFLLPASVALVFLGYGLSLIRRWFYFVGSAVTIVVFLMIVASTSGYNILLNQIVLEILFLLAAGLWTGELFNRALKPARERRLIRQSQHAFSGKVCQIYHDDDEALDLLRHVRKSRVRIASEEQAGRLLESVLLFAGIAAVFAVLLLILYEPTVNVLLGSSADALTSGHEAGENEVGNSDGQVQPESGQTDLEKILVVLCGTPILLGFVYFTVIMAGRLAKVWVSNPGADVVNKTLSGIISNAALGDDSSGRVVFAEERLERFPRITIPQACTEEMSQYAARSRETTFATLLANGLLQPSTWISEPESLMRYISFREVVHCGYFETDFLVNALFEQVVSHR
ncbi:MULTISPECIES: esterase/lipase family protein [Hyphomonas]|uniref:esterase/lipase family protein n=1 Tax=Hyphomonas TaxID=85 RepID=UPI0035145098